MQSFEYIDFGPIEEAEKWRPEVFKSRSEDLKERKDERLGEWNKRIDEGGYVLLAEVYDAINLPVLLRAPCYNPNLWGWDKKGFRQLFHLKTTLERIE